MNMYRVLFKRERLVYEEAVEYVEADSEEDAEQLAEEVDPCFVEIDSETTVYELEVEIVEDEAI